MPSTLKARYTLVVSCSFSIGISSGSSGVGAINRTPVVSRAGRLIAQGDELAAERGNPGNRGPWLEVGLLSITNESGNAVVKLAIVKTNG